MKYKIFFLSRVNDFIYSLPENDRAKINAARIAMELGSFETLTIKTLRTPIKELIIKKSRLLFFVKDDSIYFVNAFTKKTAKTPKKEIENAYKIYKGIINLN